MNRFPTTDSKKRLAIVMLAPSSLEGAGYSLLQAALQQHTMRLSDCFVGFISRDATYSLDFKSSDVEECMAQLKEDLNKFQPYCVLYLGETVLKAVRVFHSIGTYRGVS